MEDIKELSFEEMLKKMNELQQIEINWKDNKNPTQLRQSIKNLGLDELNFIVDKIDDPVIVAKIAQLFFYKFFAIINIKIKDLLMSYKDNPYKIMELQSELQKVFNFDFNNMNFGGMFSDDDSLSEDFSNEKTSEESDKEKNRKLN